MMHKGPIFLFAIFLAVCYGTTETRGATYTLTVAADHGSVQVSPEKAQYDEGEIVELIPRPEVGYNFGHWSGDLRGRRLVGRVTMDSNKSITAHFQTWQPPIGIPAPEFGIFETYRMYDVPANRNPELTYHQNAEGGFYTHYIDATDPASTNTDNPCGTVDMPRSSIPNGLAEGSVVEIHGAATASMYNTYTTGSREKPVFIRGGDPHEKASIQSHIIAKGQYVIWENLLFNETTLQPRVHNGSTISELSIRNCEFIGRGIGLYGGPHHIVIYGNTVHDGGDMSPEIEHDVHGVSNPYDVNDVWVVDNHVYHMGGDSVQVGSAGGMNPERVQRTYIGRNIFHDNGENCVDVKAASTVVISENEMYGGFPSAGDPIGSAVVTHDGPLNVWLIGNVVHDSHTGFRIESSSTYVTANLIYGMREIPAESHSETSIWRTGAGIFSQGNNAVVSNAVHDCELGISMRVFASGAYVANNVVSDPYDNPETGREGNPYAQEVLNGGILLSESNLLDVVGADCFENISSLDFCLAPGSSAVDAAIESDVFQIFFDLYGINIRKDIAGRVRPAGGGWDIGAYEYVLEGIEDLATSGVSQNSVTVGWTIPGIDGMSDRPGRYDIRYAQSPLTEANWDAATQVLGEPEPADVGDTQSFTITGLNPGTTYHFGLKTSNTSASTVSSLSNVISATTTGSGNRAPVIAPIGDKAVAENTTLTFTVSASDADGDTLNWSATGVPSGAAFNTASRTFSWTPTNTQGGTHWVTFTVTDGQVPVSETVEITVAEIVNNAPVLAAIGNKSTDENELLSFSVSATDADGHSLTYSATGLPSGANFTGQTFTWVPTYDQADTYAVTFAVSDGELTDSEQITITVANVTPDLTDPSASASYPATDAIQIPVNPVISLTVSDTGRGVDADTVTIRVNDQLVYSGDTVSYQSAYGVCRRTGTQASYRYSCEPASAFRFDEQVSVRVTASDLAGNAMTPYTYSFTTEMRVFGDNHPASWAPDDLDKSRPATVCDSAGNIWVAYHAGPAGQRDVYVSKLTLGGANFAGPVQLTSSGNDQSFPAIGIGVDDRLYVVWQDNRRGNWDIYIRTSADGVTWTTETRITDSDHNQIRPAIAVDGQSPSQVHIAWQDDGAGNQDIYVASSSNSFATKTVAQVTTNSAQQTAPAIAVNAANAVFLAWTDSRNGSSDIYGAASSNGPWTNVTIATGAGNQSAVALAADASGTRLHFAWADDASGNSDIRYASSDGLPSSPLAGTRIVDDTSAADQTAPTLVAAGSAGASSRVFVCWVDERNANASGLDTDLYFVEVSGGQGTNVLVGDGGTASDQSEPALGIDLYGYPYVLWTDHRNVTDYVYYAGSTYIAPSVMASGAVTASTGRTIGTASPSSADHVSAVIPAGACPHDVTISISRILNPQSILSSNVIAYDFGPSGIQFSQPVTLTIPYLAADYSGGTPLPCWYVSQTGTLSQQGITNIQVLDLSSTLKAVRFQTTHFTPYYLLESYVDDGGDDGSWDGDDDAPVTGGGGGGGGGGGCSVAPGAGGDFFSYLAPYLVLAVVMGTLRVRDRRAARRS